MVAPTFVYVPIAHAVHAALPEDAYVPALQTLHTVSALPPAAAAFPLAAAAFALAATAFALAGTTVAFVAAAHLRVLCGA